MSFSANGKFLATCAEDRAIFIWNTKDWKERDHKSLRYNVDFDHASHITWSPDSKAFIYNRSNDKLIEVCKVSRKTDGWIASVSKALTFPKVHNNETVGLGIAVNGKYIMSCSSGTDIVLWDLKGSELARLDTYLMNNYTAKISPCGRFIAASGFTPDVKVWEVVFSKSGEFKQVARAFELTGHSSGVWDFAFNADSSKIATISKDGSWRLFDTKIEFEKGEEPHLLMSGKHKTDNAKSSLALSPDGQVIALASASNLTFINLIDGKIDKTISNIYTGPITRICFDSAGDYVLTAGEKHVRVFHNVTGRKANIQSARTKLQASGNSLATKERLQEIIDKAEAFLTGIGEKV
ncbi:hypothetical protein AAG570_010433 [Ranatra chinensis]|uniref:Uncharacterized protein n=1 Tax=Ranatra chinensis TaxID=642074 RepID=A0ABD0Z4M4_9HEMI